MPREDTPIIKSYNPPGKRSLGTSVAATMPASPVHTFPSEPSIGTGAYVIYYRGDFVPYKRLVDLDKEGYNVPIYVGEAVPAGARKGGLGTSVGHGLALLNRLSEHFGSVSGTSNLNEKDFMCRYPIVDDIWTPLAESMLIGHSKPSRSRCIDGFGNHDLDKGCYQQQKSP